MSDKKVYTVIGLMSGTSLDGVDAAMIRTDGYDHVERIGFVTIPYAKDVQKALRACFGKQQDEQGAVAAAERILTETHADAVKELLDHTGCTSEEVDLIGFHGQTIFHDPVNRFTWQIGDGDLLAQLTGIDVINDFRTADVKAGGEGAPLLPLYHRALVKNASLDLPVVILNIGGVANVTWIGGGTDHEILAFDTGPGNALMDDWAQKHTDKRYDVDGTLAHAGHSVDYILEDWYTHDYFKKPPPKSLDRDEWDIAAFGQLGEGLGDLSPEDGAATLLVFTAETIIGAQSHMPQMPKAWYVCGGGRHNKALMRYLKSHLKKVESVEVLGWDGDATEAEGFAYLAVRSKERLPLSLPTTTGIQAPLTGGRYFRAA